MKKSDRYSDDIRDVIYCLSNNELPNLFNKVRTTYTISSGASVAHIGVYIGILLRGKNKLDREGRDYWIKHLVEIGVLEPITLKDSKFVSGHIKAKSPNSAYKLSNELIKLINNIQNRDLDKEIEQLLNSAQEHQSIYYQVRAEDK